uniref:Uncharacterized protein n=1 Tax=Loxodonta africana TaxID=9785 RepID=G3UM06_LOXAF
GFLWIELAANFKRGMKICVSVSENSTEYSSSKIYFAKFDTRPRYHN